MGTNFDGVVFLLALSSRLEDDARDNLDLGESPSDSRTTRKCQLRSWDEGDGSHWVCGHKRDSPSHLSREQRVVLQNRRRLPSVFCHLSREHNRPRKKGTDRPGHLCCLLDVRLVDLELARPEPGVPKVGVLHVVEHRLLDRSEQDPERLVRLVDLVGLQMTGNGGQEGAEGWCVMRKSVTLE